MKEDWIEIELGEVFEIVTGNTPSKKDKDNYGNDIPFVKPPEINNQIIKTTADALSTKGKKIARILPITSVLVTCIGNLGRVGINKKEVAFNQQINAIKPSNYIDSLFTFYQAQSVMFRNSLEKLSTSTTVALVNKSNFSTIKFKLAPLPIQRVIVSKIESLFSDLDNGIANLKKAQEQLKIYRQAVLKKAFEGELTKEWRQQRALSGVEVPTAEELLEQIKEERQNHYNKQIEDWKKAVKEWEKKGKEGKKPSKPKTLISYPIIEQDNVLPIVNLGELVFQISNKLMPNEAPNLPFIGMDCLNKNALKPHFTYTFKEFKSAGNWFDKNHILYGRLRPYLNKVYMAEYEGVASGEFIILETTNSIKPNYLKLILHQQDFVHWSNKQSSGDKPRVKFDQIALYNIRVPSIQEQHQIVQEIETRLSVCDKVEQSITESLEKAKALRQSILKKAFEGKLLTEQEIAQCKQEPDYEPASVLLERIKNGKLRITNKRKSEKMKNNIKQGNNIIHFEYFSGLINNDDILKIEQYISKTGLELSYLDKSGKLYNNVWDFTLQIALFIKEPIVQNIILGVAGGAVWDAIKVSAIYIWKKVKDKSLNIQTNKNIKNQPVNFGLHIKKGNTTIDFNLSGKVNEEIVLKALDKIPDIIKNTAENTTGGQTFYQINSDSEWTKVNIVEEIKKRQNKSNSI